jgi:hypothetical protein
MVFVCFQKIRLLKSFDLFFKLFVFFKQIGIVDANLIHIFAIFLRRVVIGMIGDGLIMFFGEGVGGLVEDDRLIIFFFEELQKLNLLVHFP